MSPIKEYLVKAFRHLVANIKSEKAEIGKDIQKLSDLVAEGLQEVEAAIDGKQDKSEKMSVTIPVSGWTEDTDNTSVYKYYYDINALGVMPKDKADITISLSSLNTAVSCGLCPVNETLEGKIRIRTINIPDSSIIAEYWIEYGRE